MHEVAWAEAVLPGSIPDHELREVQQLSPMPGSASEDLMQEDAELLLGLLKGALDNCLLHSTPRATEALLYIEQTPQLFHQSIHEFLAAIMCDKHRPSLRAANTLQDRTSQIGVPHAGHALEQGRSCGDAHMSARTRSHPCHTE